MDIPKNKGIGVQPPFQMKLNHAVDWNQMIERKNMRSPDR